MHTTVSPGHAQWPSQRATRPDPADGLRQPATRPFSPDGVLALQRSAGNRAAAALVSPGSQITVQRWGRRDVAPGPSTIESGPRRITSVWAEQLDAHGTVCHDARSTGHGQGGWELGINYITLADLIRALHAEVTPGSVHRLAINAHGLAGAVNFEGEQDRTLITFERIEAARAGRTTVPQDPTYEPAYVLGVLAQLAQVRMYLAPGALVMLAGCLVGQTARGVRLLRALTGPDIFGTDVLAFTTMTAEMGDQIRDGQQCSEPGTRVTNMFELPAQGVHPDHSGEHLPWTDVNSPHSRYAHPGGWIWDQDRRQNIEPGHEMTPAEEEDDRRINHPAPPRPVDYSNDPTRSFFQQPHHGRPHRHH